MRLFRRNAPLTASLLVAAVLGLNGCYKNEAAPNTAPIPILVSSPITGAQERPNPVNSPGSGTFMGSIDPTTKVMSYTVTYSGITPVAGHIHQTTMANGNGPVIFPFPSAALASPIIGTTAPLAQSRIDSMLVGLFYVNLHTAANPGGEIRGNFKK